MRGSRSSLRVGTAVVVILSQTFLPLTSAWAQTAEEARKLEAKDTSIAADRGDAEVLDSTGKSGGFGLPGFWASGPSCGAGPGGGGSSGGPSLCGGGKSGGGSGGSSGGGFPSFGGPAKDHFQNNLQIGSVTSLNGSLITDKQAKPNVAYARAKTGVYGLSYHQATFGVADSPLPLSAFAEFDNQGSIQLGPNTIKGDQLTGAGASGQFQFRGRNSLGVVAGSQGCGPMVNLGGSYDVSGQMDAFALKNRDYTGASMTPDPLNRIQITPDLEAGGICTVGDVTAILAVSEGLRIDPFAGNLVISPNGQDVLSPSHKVRGRLAIGDRATASAEGTLSHHPQLWDGNQPAHTGEIRVSGDLRVPTQALLGIPDHLTVGGAISERTQMGAGWNQPIHSLTVQGTVGGRF